MNVEIGTEAPIFLSWEYLLQIFGILSLQCGLRILPTGLHVQLISLGVHLVGCRVHASVSCVRAFSCLVFTPVSLSRHQLPPLNLNLNFEQHLLVHSLLVFCKNNLPAVCLSRLHFLSLWMSGRGLQGDVIYLFWPIAPLVYEPKWGGGGRSRWGAAGSQPMRTAVHITWHEAQINFGDLTPYLTYSMMSGQPTLLLLRK